MTRMIAPTAAEVVRCVNESITSQIVPVLTKGSEKSVVATIQHLLRYIELRIDLEGQTLLDEVQYLGKLLPQATAWLGTQPGSSALISAIDASIAFERDPTVYPSLTIMNLQVAELRQHVCDILLSLQDTGPTAPDSDGARLHEAIRTYVSWQLEQEGSVIEPSFVGFGPRR
jgi:hypothetical protein